MASRKILFIGFNQMTYQLRMTTLIPIPCGHQCSSSAAKWPLNWSTFTSSSSFKHSTIILILVHCRSLTKVLAICVILLILHSRHSQIIPSANKSSPYVCLSPCLHPKGDGCFEKPLATLWRNYTQVQKPDVLMRIKVCPSGLKATTKQHGLTEYWSHRITHCSSPKNYPRVFCWIYRHEGRKMKHELRCHAVLCSKDITAKDICSQLQVRRWR